ncbi:uncharacterized protein LOC115727014 isoform X1 [Rhodamnia argentea]|uniref:Uncharacterized protein LOC115727014 isoform X1 n=1 Tax=Rhodamnia argentea TaxID=178133 RepID=A0A8B8MSB9_9MYRT|nr:uncharacterized protein LOC115727014 isoform X1 [Rhodamnia argentea]XP_030512981.1 uncharacterized protein LOC115727014 isoform X1 [Rhodamnia argentea]XP_048131010.1 uncharacterized protein LOC115727014 isoform X1 [Rhodamnia argentea]
MVEHEQLFEVGQEAEVRTFMAGYRGAWFRCKQIRGIRKRRGEQQLHMEYFDFPDEKITWTNVYEKSPHSPVDAKLKRKKQLMVRPRFPSVYHRSEMPNGRSISDVAVIVDDDWKVGDMVDWWSDDCYWSGRVTEVLADKKFQIELHAPPAGEGESYEAFSKDLRPSLDWSIENGWMVCSLHFSQWIKPPNEGRLLLPADMASPQEVPLDINAFEKSPPETHTNSEKSPREKYENSAVASSGLGKANSCDGVSSYNVRVASAEMEASFSKENNDYDLHCRKKLKSDDHTLFNSMFSDTLEDAIIDLEELANRVRWLKDILELRGHPSKNVKSSWKFLELRASATSK